MPTAPTVIGMTTTLIINALLWLAALAAVFGVFGLTMRGLGDADVAQSGMDYDLGWDAEQDELAAAA